MTNTAAPAPTTDRTRIRPRVVIAAWLLYGIVSLNQSILWYEIANRPINLESTLAFTITLCATWLLFSPVVIWAARRFPLGQSGWQLNLLAHVGIIAVLTMLDVRIDRWVGPHFGFGRPSVYWQQYINDLDLNVFYYAVIAAVVMATDFHFKYRERQRKAAELHSELVTSKLQMLKMQLQPHFLFNTLNTINALIHEDAEAADRMVTRLADLLRLTLYENRHEVPLARELEFVSAYVDIQQIRFQNRLTVSFEVKGALLGAQVPSLMLQPLVENAIRHGITPRARAGQVTVRALRSADRLVLEVEDDGIGLPEGEDVMVTGIGLANTRARLQQLYASDFEFAIRSREHGGTRVRIAIPYQEAPAEPAAEPRLLVAGA